MKRKKLIIFMSSLAVVVLVSGVVVFSVFGANDATALGSDHISSITGGPTEENSEEDQNDSELDYTYIPPTEEDVIQSPTPIVTEPPEEPFVPATEMDLEPSSITVFVNKEYALPKNYKPDNLVKPDIYFNMTYYDERTLMRSEAAASIEQLFLAASKDGIMLSGVSGYRSYARQYKIFTDNIVAKGKDHTLRYSAVPGTSEHQTGLSMDISCESLDYDLSTAFANTPEGKWVAENAHRFGFIVRYPKGKAKITGYSFEPWHIRYVGKGLANYLYENDLTLEEYYNYTPSKDFDFEALYADLINYAPSITPLPSGAAGVILGENGEIIEEGPGAIPTKPAGTDDSTVSGDTSDGTGTNNSDTSDDNSDSEDTGNPADGSDVSDGGSDTSDPGDVIDNGDTSSGDNNDNGSTEDPGNGDSTTGEPTVTPTPTTTPTPTVPAAPDPVMP